MPSILFVTKSQMNRGSFWRGWYLGNELTKLGVHFTLVCPDEYRNLGVTIREQSDSFRVITLPRFSEKTTVPGMIVRSLISPSVYGLEKFDLVHVCAPAFPETYLSASIAHVRGIPLLVDIDDWWGIDPDRKRRLIESRFEQILENRAVHMSDSALVASNMLRNKIKDHTGVTAEVLPNGIDPADFLNLDSIDSRRQLLSSNSVGDSSTIIAMAADLTFEPLIYQLGRKLADVSPNVHILVIGSSSDHSTQRNVINMPKLPRKEWLRVLSGVDAILFLMHNTQWEMARFPIKLAEFMATGRPIISSAVGESKRILNEGGYSNLKGALFTENTVEGIMKSIAFYLNDKGACEVAAQSAKRFAMEKLSWTYISTQYMQILKASFR